MKKHNELYNGNQKEGFYMNKTKDDKHKNEKEKQSVELYFMLKKLGYFDKTKNAS